MQILLNIHLKAKMKRINATMVLKYNSLSELSQGSPAGLPFFGPLTPSGPKKIFVHKRKLWYNKTLTAVKRNDFGERSICL